MAKYENIRALAKKQLQAVTESSDTVSRYLTRGQILPGCGICLTFPIPSPVRRSPTRCRGSLQTRTGGLFGIKS